VPTSELRKIATAHLTAFICIMNHLLLEGCIWDTDGPHEAHGLCIFAIQCRILKKVRPRFNIWCYWDI